MFFIRFLRIRRCGWKVLEAKLEVLRHLGGTWRLLEALGGSWRHLGGSRRHLGGSWRHLGGILEASWRILGGSWRILETKMEKTTGEKWHGGGLWKENLLESGQELSLGV